MSNPATPTIQPLTFEFGKYTEITEMYFRLKPEMNDGSYIRFFICPDVRDTHLVRVQKDVNAEYEQEEGCFLAEQNEIPNEYKGQKLTIGIVKQIILEDDLSKSISTSPI